MKGIPQTAEEFNALSKDEKIDFLTTMLNIHHREPFVRAILSLFILLQTVGTDGITMTDVLEIETSTGIGIFNIDNDDI
jgi:hypothetical protein